MEKSPNAGDRDQAFQELLQKYPASDQIATNYALYLTKSGRLTAAIDLLNEQIDKRKSKRERWPLVRTVIYLPLEAKSAVLAEQQLNRHRANILPDKLTLAYFEARVLYLQNEHKQAVEKLTTIIEAERNQPGGARLLAGEALRWIQQIMADKTVSDQLKTAADVAKKQVNTPVPTESEPQESEAK